MESISAETAAALSSFFLLVAFAYRFLEFLDQRFPIVQALLKAMLSHMLAYSKIEVFILG